MNKNVLELGCAFGVMTKVLAENNHCCISAIEVDSASGEAARPYCDRLLIADLNTLDWDSVFGSTRFDVIVAADVVEHLTDPWRCVAQMRRFLAPEGYIVLSVPNVAHNGVVAELLTEDFKYRKTGLLDETHIRFFGWEGVVRALRDAGLKITDVAKSRMPPAATEFAEAWNALPEWFGNALSARPEGDVYQYIVKAVPAGDDARLEIAPAAHSLKLSLGRDEVLLKAAERYRAECGAVRLERDAALAERDVARIERDVAVAARDLAEASVEVLRNSMSWRLMGPVRFVFRTVRSGLRDEDRRVFVKAMRSLYHRLPLPSAARKRVRLAYNQLVRTPCSAVRRWMLERHRFQLPSERPKAQQLACPDYIVWGVIDWHLRHQRPQQLAQALAALGRRVFYVSAALVDDGRGGFDAERLDASGRLFQVRLYSAHAPAIYESAPTAGTVEQLRQSVGALLGWADCRQVVCLVQHPFWLDIARVVPNSRMVYDCIDHHEGFGNTGAAVLFLERLLLKQAEVTVVTSDWLEQAIAEHAAHRVVIRNAADFAHFHVMPPSAYKDPAGRRVIGYYGAIADWFDLDLIASTARRFADCCVLLIGADSVDAKARLSALPNIVFTGEVPYGDLPRYLHGFDVCLLPFRVTPLTLATNPVKIYEYLSAGKPVVSVDLPEIAQFGDLVRRASGTEAFLSAVTEALAEPRSSADVGRRQAFAADQTWAHRVDDLIAAAEVTSVDPLLSVIVVTYNNLDLTRACLVSLKEYTDYERTEIIVVDNGSADGTADFLPQWAAGCSNRTVVLNSSNRGFAAANNQGLERAKGQFLVMLNNDTYVTPGWAVTLMRHLRHDTTIGIIGPVTNNIGNAAKIDIAYRDMEEMRSVSADFVRQHIGQVFPIRTAAFFCVMMGRATYERVGPLDEAFGQGFFEDDDYCRRVERAGLRILCARDAFVHHHLSASFDKLKTSDRQVLFERNRAIYETKWGKWTPHTYAAHDSVAVAAEFRGAYYYSGRCNVCGNGTRYFYTDSALFRESLTCEHCRTTSRYRSIARGVLLAVRELAGIDAESLAQLPRTATATKLRVYDTQPAFYYKSCAYPLPDILGKLEWIDLHASLYKPERTMGATLSKGVTNQNLEALTFPNGWFDVVVTSDVMEHVRLDTRAHTEIYRVLKPGGIYLFTVPHDRSWERTLVRVEIVDVSDPTKDVHVLEPEYHGDGNSTQAGGVLAYRTYGKDLEVALTAMGFEVLYTREDYPEYGILNTELYYCRKVR